MADVGQSDTNIQLEPSETPQSTPKRTVLLTQDGFRRLLGEEARKCGSQAELARRLGVTGQFIGRLIDGTKRPGPKLLAAFNARTTVMIEMDISEGE